MRSSRNAGEHTGCRKSVSKWWVVLLSACGAAPPIHVTCSPCPECERPVAPPVPHVEEQPSPEEIAASSPWRIASLHEDVDGDGDPELIELFSDGSVHVGQAAGVIQLRSTLTSRDETWSGTMSIVDVRRGDGHREVLVFEDGAYEAPQRSYTILSARGELLYGTWPAITIPYDATQDGSRPWPILAGDGTIRMRFEHCDGYVVRTTIEHRMMPDGSIRAIREHVDHTDRTCQLAACPYVFVGDRFAGEILRDLVGASAEAEQTLELPNVIVNGTLTVTLREVKPEITYLDELHVVADGRVIRARECGEACADDGVYTTLAMGEARSYVFDVGEARRVTLVARGYYVPWAPSP